MSRKPPRLTVAFLRALERSGEVEAAARDAGIDTSTAYARRKAHAGFAQSWDEALRLRSGRAEEEVQERVGFWETLKGKVPPKLLSSTQAAPSPGSPPASPTSRSRGRGADRELLASTALGGKMERPDFRAKWDAVLETGRAAIEMHLVETAKKSFDPDDLDIGDIQPKVSVAEAIKIVQLHGNKAQRSVIEEIEPPEEEIEAVRTRLFNKLERLRKREMPRKIEQGWSYDEEHDHMVPPGWVRQATFGSPDD